jgi:hypothetical protein
MAEDEPTTHLPHEIQALADRLEARGTGKLFEAQPEHAGDLRAAAILLRRLALKEGQ